VPPRLSACRFTLVCFLKIFSLDVFAVNPDYSKRFFYRNDTGQFEPFYAKPQFVCQTSPNRKWRMEGVGMYLDCSSGLHSLEEMRIIDLSTGSIEWSGESYLSNRFIWSEDSRFVAAQYSGRQWTATQVIDTNDFSIINSQDASKGLYFLLKHIRKVQS